MRNLINIFDAFSDFDRTFTNFSRTRDDIFRSFFNEIYSNPEENIEVNGERLTYINGMLVKKELSDGSIEHYQNGRLHNISGPAIERKKGQSEYWLDGRCVSKIDHDEYIKKLQSEKKSPYKVELNEDERKKVEDALGRKI